MRRSLVAFLLALVVLLAGCGSSAPATTPSPRSPAVESSTSATGFEGGADTSSHAIVSSPSTTNDPTGADEAAVLSSGENHTPPEDVATGEPSAPAPEGCLAKAPKPPSSVAKAVVVRAVDGDTLEFSDGERVRLIGINTPESVDPRRSVEAYGKEAAAYTQQLTAGQEVFYVPGRTPRDRYGRLLAWVWLPDGTFLNALLVRDGYAQVYTFSDNPDHADLLLECQREAREASRGLWGLAEYHDGEVAAGAEQDAAVEESASSTDPESYIDQAATAAPQITREPGVVRQGGTATVTVKTRPGDRCDITVIYKSGPSTAKGLVAKQADASGFVSWSWTVGSRTTPGSWPVVISCDSGTVKTQVTVR